MNNDQPRPSWMLVGTSTLNVTVCLLFMSFWLFALGPPERVFGFLRESRGMTVATLVLLLLTSAFLLFEYGALVYHNLQLRGSCSRC